MASAEAIALSEQSAAHVLLPVESPDSTAAPSGPRQRTSLADEGGAVASAPAFAPPHLSLLALFKLFLLFGVRAWGGPVAQIEMLRAELVTEQKWVSPDSFKRTLAVYQVRQSQRHRDRQRQIETRQRQIERDRDR